MKKLKTEQIWCVRDEKKHPFYRPDEMASSSDKSTWLSYDEAVHLLQENEAFTGLGFFISTRHEKIVLCGIDIDAPGHNADTVNPLADEIISMFSGTYIEKSPSGGGYHIICNVDLDWLPFTEDNYPYYKKNDASKLEIYIGTMTNRYFTYTGKKIDSCADSITDQMEKVFTFLNRYMVRPKQLKKKIENPVLFEPPNLDDIEVPFDLQKRLDVIRKSVKCELFEKLFVQGNIQNYQSKSEADFALLCMLVPWLEGNPKAIDKAYRLSALYPNQAEKWDSKRGNLSFGQLNIMFAIAAVDEPYYTESEDYATGDSINPQDIVEFIDAAAAAEATKDKISVLPIACGLGKSTSISYKIAQVLNAESTDGLIVVTDLLERMYQYTAPTNERLANLKEYLDLHAKDISILDSDSLIEEMKRQSQCKILIMTTQRLIKQLSKEQIQQFTRWDHGRRPLMIIDEQPGILETNTLTTEKMSKVETVFNRLDSKDEDEDEWRWCSEQWDHVKKKIMDLEREFGRLHDGHSYYFRYIAQDQMTDDDTRFTRFIYSYKRQLILEKVYTIIQSAQYMFTHWCVIQKENRKVTFNTIVDHTDKLVGCGAKVVILDGTADLSPEYDKDCFDIQTRAEYRRWLNRLSIKNINYPTTRDHLKSADPESLAERLKDYAWRINRSKKKRSVIFTYMDNENLKLETELKKYFNSQKDSCNVDHFGAIRGKNTYSDATLIIQFGLHRYPNVAYMQVFIQNNGLWDTLKSKTQNNASEYLDKLEKSAQIDRIRSRMILTDIEQNFYRGIIREQRKIDPMKYHIFCSQNNTSDLLYLMQLRYWPLRAKIDTQNSAPVEFMALRSHENKAPNIILKWLNDIPVGKRFTLVKIALETGLSISQVRSAASRNKQIANMLKKWELPDKGMNNKRRFIKQEERYHKKINLKKKV